MAGVKQGIVRFALAGAALALPGCASIPGMETHQPSGSAPAEAPTAAPAAEGPAAWFQRKMQEMSSAFDSGKAAAAQQQWENKAPQQLAAEAAETCNVSVAQALEAQKKSMLFVRPQLADKAKGLAEAIIMSVPGKDGRPVEIAVSEKKYADLTAVAVKDIKGKGVKCAEAVRTSHELGKGDAAIRRALGL